MIATLRLGLRLAGVGAAAGTGRVRSGLVALVAVVGTMLLLSVLAIAHAESGRSDHGLVSESGMSLLLATVVITVGLPVLVLAATAGRLAAAMRDRRLANLRLLGMTPGRTRVVAAVETGAAAGVGTLLGGVSFVVMRPVLAGLQLVGRHWTTASLNPTALGTVVVLLVVPSAVTLVSAWPARAGGHHAMSLARQASVARPAWWRLAPMGIGIMLALYVLVAADPRNDVNEHLTPYMFAAIIALGLGMVLIVPVFVRLVADALVRHTAHPALLIAGRRLQAQPAGTTRLVAGLLIGLFLVTGARAVVVAFEQTPQYQTAAAARAAGQVATFYVPARRAASLRDALHDQPVVAHTAAFPVLSASCGHGTVCEISLIGTCAQLADIFGPTPRCRDDEPAWLSPPPAHPKQRATSLSLRRWSGLTKTTGQAIHVPVPTYRLPRQIGEQLEADVFLPRSLPGLATAASHTQIQVVAAGRPGADLTSAWQHGAPQAQKYLYAPPDTSYYNFVAGLRELVWAIAAVVLSLGLLGFAIGAVDRAMTRRAELVSLQLSGVPPPLLRRIQWIEVALPLIVGIVLAIGLGALAGATYLAFGNEAPAMPWRQTLTLTIISTAAATMVTALTLIAASPRIRPETIRAE